MRAPRAAGARNICVRFADVTRIRRESAALCHANVTRKIRVARGHHAIVARTCRAQHGMLPLDYNLKPRWNMTSLTSQKWYAASYWWRRHFEVKSGRAVVPGEISIFAVCVCREGSPTQQQTTSMHKPGLHSFTVVVITSHKDNSIPGYSERYVNCRDQIAWLVIEWKAKLPSTLTIIVLCYHIYLEPQGQRRTQNAACINNYATISATI
jgi:hypothetical protein